MFWLHSMYLPTTANPWWIKNKWNVLVPTALEARFIVVQNPITAYLEVVKKMKKKKKEDQ